MQDEFIYIPAEKASKTTANHLAPCHVALGLFNFSVI
jgi:hypothetical protein